MDNIFNRQLGLIHPEKLKIPILIVGAGSIGSWACLALSKLGCSNITVMDGDTIEVHNSGSQIYKASDAGEDKIAVLGDKVSFISDGLTNGIAAHWNPENPEHVKELDKYAIVISAVDNITTRTQLFEQVRDKNVLYIDARMAANALEIYTVRGGVKEDGEAYEETLFDSTDEIPVECSERSVVYNVFCVASLIGDLVAKYANGKPIPKEILVDLENFTMYKTE